VRVYSNNPGDKFAALSTIDYGGQTYDWGYTLEPRKDLSTQVLVGLGLGCTEPGTTIGGDRCTRSTDSRSVIWVTPTKRTTIYVNRDGSQASCPGGVNADDSRTLDPLEAWLLTTRTTMT
jgi:hypothetical protein